MSIVYNINKIITEDDVENKFVQPLFNDILNYDLNNDFKWKETITYNSGREKVSKIADLVIYRENKPVIVVEAKRPTESLLDGISQVDSYAFAKEVRYTLITNGKKLVLREYLAGNKKINIIETTVKKLIEDNFSSLINLISIENIDVNKNVVSQKIEKFTNQITDYRRFFRSIHNIIRNNEKLDPASCFDEFSKILYLKMANQQYQIEGLTNNIFDIDKFINVPGQDPMILVNKWFKDAMKKYYIDVFEEIPELNIGISTLNEVLEKLDGFYVKDDNFDIKGRAFEEFLPSQLRGKGLGQFFTPRKIVDFMADLVEISINDIVVDFSCGSGGFLIKAFDKMKSDLNLLPNKTFEQIGTTKSAFEDDLKKNQLFGIDAEPRAVRIAKMNMMLWGDGKKIVRGNGLSTKDWRGKDYYISEYNEKKGTGGCTLILANPPFIKEKDPQILSRFILGSEKNSVDAQTLFIERGINLLKPGGRMAIVLPEGVFSNDDSLPTREYILKNSKIKAIVELPTHTFVQSGVDTINTVILYIEKFDTEYKNKLFKLLGDDVKENMNILRENLNYDIFMGSAENLGYEPNGRIFSKPSEKTDLDIILEKYNDPEFKNEKKELIEESIINFESDDKNYRGLCNMNDCMKINIKETENRLDPSYYLFFKNMGEDLKNFIALENYDITFQNEKLNLNTEESLDKEYCVCSVNKNNPDNLLEVSNYVTGDEISHETTKKMIVPENSIVYNPYRASIGSFAYVPESLNNSVTSGAYVCFKVKKFNLKLLVYLLKTPIYNKYIKILSTGSVRDNFSDECLKKILVPKLSVSEQEKLLLELEKINKLKEEKNKEKKQISLNGIQHIYSELNIV